MKNRKNALFYRDKEKQTMKNDRISEKIVMTAARALAEWEKSSATLDDCLDAIREEGGPGKSAAASLLFEYFRHKKFVDDLIAAHARKGNVKPELRILLACTLTQAIFQTGIAAQSAVNVAVDCAKRRFGNGPASFVNAMLRAVLASNEAKNPPPFSFPESLRERWRRVFGEQFTADMLACYASNPPPVFRLRGELPPVEEPDLFRELALPPFADGFRFFEILKPAKFFALPWLEQGLVYVQDPATAWALSLLEKPVSGAVLDACAAPGGKSILLWDMADRDRLKLTVADRSSQRLAILKSNLARAGVRAKTVQASAQENPFPDAAFDLILADVPCGNSGVIRRRCDAPWRFREQQLGDLSALQTEILSSLARLIKPGGRILYSTCSIEREEDEQPVERFLAANPAFQLEKQQRLMPSAVNDGAFGALLIRKS